MQKISRNHALSSDVWSVYCSSYDFQDERPIRNGRRDVWRSTSTLDEHLREYREVSSLALDSTQWHWRRCARQNYQAKNVRRRTLFNQLSGTRCSRTNSLSDRSHILEWQICLKKKLLFYIYWKRIRKQINLFTFLNRFESFNLFLLKKLLVW